MAETQILGVDFSGGGDDDHVGNTWFSKGRLDGNMLTIDDCKSISRRDLEKKLEKLPAGAVAAMDFPFGVPMEFALWLASGWSIMPTDMTQIWQATKTKWKEYAKFDTECRNYEKEQKPGHKNPLRIGDVYSIRPLSPVNIRIRRMTFHGMKMLSELWDSKRGFQVPPLREAGREGPVLLEVMPGVALETFGLRSTLYKDPPRKKDPIRRENREEILRGLCNHQVVGLRLCIGKNRKKLVDHHDALDSLVAAIVAARCAMRKSDFQIPNRERTVTEVAADCRRLSRVSPKAKDMVEMDAARLEGWIYAPRPIS